MKKNWLLLVSILAVCCKSKESPKESQIFLENKVNRDIVSNQGDNRKTLDKLLDQAVKENKSLFLVFGFEKCGWCKVFKRYHQDPAVEAILSRHFIVAEIDYNKTPNGMELYRTYGSTGFPSWTILDQTGKVISDSEAPMPGVKSRTYNVGYPAGTDRMAWYISSLKSAAPAISLKDCEILREKLSYYHQNH
jgi:thioredoxin-related protein